MWEAGALTVRDSRRPGEEHSCFLTIWCNPGAKFSKSTRDVVQDREDRNRDQGEPQIERRRLDQRPAAPVPFQQLRPVRDLDVIEMFQIVSEPCGA